MKQIFSVLIMMAMMACNGVKESKDASSQAVPFIGQPDVKIENGQMTPEVLWAFGRVGNLSASPDGKRVAYTVTYYSIAENKSNADIFIVDSDGRNRKQLTKTTAREGSLAWLPSGKAIAFVREGKLWNIDPDSGAETQVSNIEQSIDGFLYAPADNRIAFVISVKLEKYKAQEKYDDLKKAEAYVYDDLMYRHWNEWKDGYYNHVFIGQIQNGSVKTVEDVMPDEPFDAPVKPFGGTEGIAWSADAQTLVYTCKKLVGKA
ncbi:MAG: hypothetical protein LBT35_01245 [Tannerella sp.]|jgi:dipeptidyl aminopeptidase/acylaminoacyl peptidase|nr:hypothetical protein [Tannerella sp.]